MFFSDFFSGSFEGTTFKDESGVLIGFPRRGNNDHQLGEAASNLRDIQTLIDC